MATYILNDGANKHVRQSDTSAKLIEKSDVNEKNIMRTENNLSRRKIKMEKKIFHFFFFFNNNSLSADKEIIIKKEVKY